MNARPTVVCLCGSTRFYDAFQRANYEETMRGKIVHCVGFYPHSEQQAHGEERGCTPEEKAALDDLDLRKIDLADEVLILNVGGYIGASTRRELEYAIATGKKVRYLEPPEWVSLLMDCVPHLDHMVIMHGNGDRLRKRICQFLGRNGYPGWLEQRYPFEGAE